MRRFYAVVVLTLVALAFTAAPAVGVPRAVNASSAASFVGSCDQCSAVPERVTPP
jgi:hypothetical protein